MNAVQILNFRMKKYFDSFSFASLPTWVEQIDNNEMNDLFRRGFSVWTSTDTLKKIRSGFLLKDMLDRFSKRLNPTTATDRSLRMYLYFAHDITIADMLDSLGIHMVVHSFLNRHIFYMA